MGTKIPWLVSILLTLFALYLFLFYYKLKFKEDFSSEIPGDVDMSIPPGQIVSTIPIDRNCLLESYRLSCRQKEQHFSSNKSVYDMKPYEDIEWTYDKIGGPEDSNAVNIVVPGRYPRRETRCDDLKVRQCLVTPGCGWLVDRGGHNGRCLPGTPIGPLNPRDIPDVEDSIRGNITLDNWKYAHPNPFIKQFFPS